MYRTSMIEIISVLEFKFELIYFRFRISAQFTIFLYKIARAKMLRIKLF